MEINTIINNTLKQSGYSLDNLEIDEVNFEIVLKAYSKNEYTVDESFIEFLKIFSNKRLKYNIDGEKAVINFEINKLLKAYPRKLIRQYESKYKIESIIPFANIYGGYMVVVKDINNYVYGIYDGLVLLFGKTLLDGLTNIIKNKEIKKLYE